MPSLESNPLVFVTGASRSGTTLLNRVLGAHDAILGMNELHFFGEVWDPNETKPPGSDGRVRLAAWILARQARGVWGSGPTDTEREQARRLVSGLPPDASGFDVYAKVVASLAHAAGKRIACEQTPRNIFYARRLLDGLPGARVIQLIRDPRAVVASQKNRHRRRRLGASNVPVREVVRVWLNYHPVTMAKLWARAADAGDALAGHPRFMRLRFEDLIEQPDRQIRALCEFLDVPFRPAMLDVPIAGSSQRADEGGRGFSRQSLETWRNELDPAEIAIVERLTRARMARHGYVPVNPSVGPGWLAPAFRYPVHLVGVMMANPRRAWVQIKALFGGHR